MTVLLPIYRAGMVTARQPGMAIRTATVASALRSHVHWVPWGAGPPHGRLLLRRPDLAAGGFCAAFVALVVRFARAVLPGSASGAGRSTL